MFPTLSEYNKTIKVYGAKAFRTLNNIFFIPARTTPIKIYSFGSGSFAVVFKAFEDNKEIAIRCFIGTDINYIERYKKIDQHLRKINEHWKTNIQFIENEIEVNGKLFPVVKMDWVEGLLLQKYIAKNLYNNEILLALQKQLVKTSQSLEKNNISHGDIQEGNIIIQENNGRPVVKLIDYDGMYIPDFQGENQIERGKSEYQHPNRASFIFDEKIDRFSFWVILCAIEALKFDKTLWQEIMQGGFNTLSNMLFSASDFSNPNESKLFNRLEQLNQTSLNFYLNKIKDSLVKSSIEQVKLFRQNQNTIKDSWTVEKEQQFEKPTNIQSLKQIEQINITSFPTGASVRNKDFKNIGITPLKIDKNKYINEEIKVIFGTKIKNIIVDEISNEINVDFENIIVDKPKVQQKESIINPIIAQKQKKNKSFIWFITIFTLLFFIAIIIGNIQNNRENDYLKEEIFDTYDSSSSFIDTDTIPTILEKQNVDSGITPFNLEDNNEANHINKSYFVGIWTDDRNNLFSIDENGEVFVKWESGAINLSKWEYYGGILYLGLGENKEMIPMQILSFSNNSFKYFINGDVESSVLYRL